MSFVDGVNSWFSAGSYWDGLGPTNVFQPDDSAAFVSQYEEIELASDNLMKNGMLASRARKGSFAGTNDPFSTASLNEALSSSIPMNHGVGGSLLRNALSSTPNGASNMLGTSPAEPSTIVGSANHSSGFGTSFPGSTSLGGTTASSLLHPRRSVTSLLSSSAHHNPFSSFTDLAAPGRSSFSSSTVGGNSLPNFGLSSMPPPSALRTAKQPPAFSLLETTSNSYNPSSSFMDSVNVDSLPVPTARRRPSSIAPIGTRPAKRDLNIPSSNGSASTDSTLRPPNPPLTNGNAPPIAAVNKVSAVAASPQTTGSSVSSSLPTLSLDFKQEYSGNNQDMSGLSSSLSKSHHPSIALGSQIWSSPPASSVGGVNVW
ncbi:hypothetical protein SPOG_00796 [Schizosaccharomyces cryophilus OY26]|uniref:Uncharacterized protein n=1 Tax=Schizosaccharomyces cryophilus (strain OY26 / ATCC MYA-4695 / CBS 11777 / NBRC 106824 / NRRL Y48691) TaxID=653667 RepID=S9X0X9_SCHCR|nr:uncharacterized protein SPOG_00796 [Schizosaccharomyces cryophilus OY26]EPY50662.1 hypothetical protein SPOG_00796 [Schizosaccharomyces cryophilus OY26]